MAEYRRFVAYVYEYRKGKKSDNCGYVRVEDRNGRCRIEVHLRCAGLASGLECKVYGFVRQQGELRGILLGVCETGEGKADCELETDSRNLRGSGRTLRELGGMALLLEGGGFYGTEWDDEPIRPGNFVEIPSEPSVVSEQPKEELENLDNKSQDTTEEVSLNQGEQEELTQSAGQQEQQEAEEEYPDTQIQEMSETPENSEEEENITEKNFAEPQTPEESGTRMDEGNSQAWQKPENVMNRERTQTSGTVQRSGNMMNQTEPQAAQPMNQPSASMAPTFDSLGDNRNNNSYPPEFDPFQDGEIVQCRRIQIKDMSNFNRRDWALRNNRFLLYGYYHFGHLLLGRLRDGQYILGVPGIYDQQERFMANMFGFPHFKHSQQVEIPHGKGGYWYRLIYPPNSNNGNGFS